MFPLFIQLIIDEVGRDIKKQEVDDAQKDRKLICFAAIF